MNWSRLIETAISVAPALVQLVENLFAHKPKSGGEKAQLALQLAQQGIVAALGIAPEAFGDPEKALIKAVNDATVAYFNAKGWTPAQ